MISKALSGLALACLMTGCISTKSYVDTSLGGVNWTEVQRPSAAHPASLDIEFYRNGERYPRADEQARGAVERALQRSGVVSLADNDAPVHLRVHVDNIADMGDAAGKGFVTGLTFGGKGSTVTDAYRIRIVAEQEGKTVEKTYDHAMHTTIGNAEPVTPATPMTPVQAFDQVIEDAVIHFIRDVQAEGMLVIEYRPGRSRLG